MTYVPAKIVASAGERDFTVPFPFISRSHVEVLVNGVLATILEWPDSSTLRLSAPLAGGESVVIQRNTPIDASLVQFQSGAILTEEDLNLAVQQLLFKQQEVTGLYDSSLREAQVRLADNLGVVTDPTTVAQQLAELVLEQQVLATFQQRIADIDLNAENIIQNALDHDNLSSAFTSEQAARAASEASILSSIGTIDTTIGTLQTDLTTLEGIVDGLANINGEGIATVIANEEAARIAGDSALATTLSLIGAKSGDNLSFILDQNTVKVSPTETLGTRLSAITSKANSNEARIITEETTRANADSALSTSLSALTARVTTAEADIISEQTTRAAGDNALASTVALIGAKNTAGDAFVFNLTTAKVSSTETLGQRLTALQAQYDDVEGLITSEQTVRAGADSALAADIAALGVSVDANAAAIVTEQVARADGDTAVAATVTALASRVDGNEAAILTEQTARSNADSALSSDLTALTARVTSTEGDIATAQADILSEATARATADSANATLISGLDTRLTTAEGDIATAEAAIVTETNARVAQDTALASSISTLTTTVNGNTASVNTLQTSINGLQARYGVSLDVNGYVTGFVQNNDGQTGTFTILADKFAIVQPGVSPFVPFEVSGGIVRIKEASIGSLQIDKLTSGVLTAGVTQNADWNVGTGKIIWDNGTFMKVAGVGFGTGGQFIEWFGPKMAINLCSEANAIQYLKTNGDAYFGGSLSAGVLKNAAQSTSIASNASVEIGPFGTNGGSITVVTSYAIESVDTATYPATMQGLSDWNTAVSNWGATPDGDYVSGSKPISCNVVVTVARTEAGVGTNGSWATLTITSGTETINGLAPSPGDAEGYLTFTRTISGSLTSTDSVGGTNNRTFTATITTRTNASTGTIQFQRVGIISTEE